MLELEPEPGDFTAFCREIHGYEPFPWQTALVDRVVKDGWPRAVSVPTGLGKTCVLDVAVFTAALERGRPVNGAGPSRAPLRIFYVVDRRLAADEVYDHAARLARALRSALSDPYADRPAAPTVPVVPTVPVGTVTGRVARALWREGDTDVLEAARMRGGVTWSANWVERPDRLAVVVGTVDQVGSRLLFRGSGTGTRRRSIDAALTGTDSLIVLDETHGSEEFAAGVRAAFALDGTPGELRPVLVTMSAVAGLGSADAHGITGDDERHPVAGPRLRSAKRLHPVEVGTDADSRDRSMAASLAAWAQRPAADAQVVGVVCNTLGRARAVLELLPGEKVLLTGRSRALDREYLRGRWHDRTKAGHESRDGGPFHVVTTQTVEVGTDLDFDALVTEAAPLPALIQRLGRLNRVGRRTDARAVVVHGTADVPGPHRDASDATWRLLTGLCPPVVTRPGETPELTGPGPAVSPAALRRLTAGLDATEWQAMRGSPPVRTPVHAAALDAWVRTEPAPDADEPVAPYLHGIGADARPVVSVAWRTREAGLTAEEWRNTVNLFPPAAEESIELPLHAVRRWLTGSPDADAISDDDAFPGPGEEPSDGPSEGGSGLEILRYRFDAATAIVTPDDIEADDLIVLPTEFGGCDAYGWNPASTDPVVDIADLVGGGDGRAGVRIGPDLATAVRVHDPALASRVDQLVTDIAADTAPFTAEQQARYRGRFAELAGSAPGDVPHLRVFSALARGGRLLTVNGLRLFVAGQAPLNGPSTAGLPQTLAEHQAEVSAAAGLYARNLHLDGRTVAAVALAAALHDEGKRDPRFQTMLHGGDEDAALAAPEPLAKSGTDPADRTGSGTARRASGYPQGMRHEALSARIAALHAAGRDDIDTDLVIHLVASHHGFARPLLPPVVDPDPRHLRLTIAGQEVVLGTAETVDRAGPARFEALNRRYGRWGLARLEALVRLADVYCSIQREI
ncbi:type I-U CRISPR-associated helicase/endonuclease Cas3 [Streptomyces sp. SID13666]|uniref:type I-G CRISPR-associated helicase/endonuclease Cas3g n=1 Tax=unclassified Streptomyces TaxID=2593676 RepID=UPI0013BFF53C|nr:MULTISPECIES: type I-U CRISPR-associated helicase/endonuclease Cas3 [unclassified Streptomyces]NEA52657.1 type I-U CRISPR-associated helicase/endonuclease Cas3 [Streptomyces sp. SID13666]NEA70016.1 type I-U CRISPR-associated helicase/endonuclease Cas3 [Streptomyces sp. SID13588]